MDGYSFENDENCCYKKNLSELLKSVSCICRTKTILFLPVCFSILYVVCNREIRCYLSTIFLSLGFSLSHFIFFWIQNSFQPSPMRNQRELLPRKSFSMFDIIPAVAIFRVFKNKLFFTLAYWCCPLKILSSFFDLHSSLGIVSLINELVFNATFSMLHRFVIVLFGCYATALSSIFFWI